MNNHGLLIVYCAILIIPFLFAAFVVIYLGIDCSRAERRHKKSNEEFDAYISKIADEDINKALDLLELRNRIIRVGMESMRYYR